MTLIEDEITALDAEIAKLSTSPCYGDEYGSHAFQCRCTEHHTLVQRRDRLKMRQKYPDGLVVTHTIRF